MNLYEVLDVAKDATEQQIKKAFRKLVHQYHPDKNPGDDAANEMFVRINLAYEVLSDPARRKLYDETGCTGGATDEDAEIWKYVGVVLSECLDSPMTMFLSAPHNNPSPGDLVSRMKSHLDSSIKNGERLIQENLKRIKHLVKIVSPFVENEDHMIFEILSGRIESLRQDNARIQLGVDGLKRAWDHLNNNYKYENKARVTAVDASKYSITWSAG